MKELFLIFSQLMPEDRLLKEMENALNNYRSTQTEDNKLKLTMWCHLFLSKHIIKDDKGGLQSVLKEMERMKQGYDLLNTKDQ